MYEEEVRCIDELKSKLEAEAPDAFAFLAAETSGAATGLEYYGMLGVAMEVALRSKLIPLSYDESVKRARLAIRRMYGV